jgi:hypothetical protein
MCLCLRKRHPALPAFCDVGPALSLRNDLILIRCRSYALT